MNVIITSLLLIATSLSGCITEELVDDILGCMDENAANYEENATVELLGDCIYMATAETFMEAMTDIGSIEDMLEDTPKAGYSQSISSSEWSEDLGMQMDVEIEDIVMADLNTDSVYVHNSMSIAGLLQIEYTHVQVGEVVNIHLLMGGMMLQGEATTGSYQTRDAAPNVLEVIAEQAGLFNEEDDDGEDDDGPVESDGFPEDAVITITMSDDMEHQTMTMEYTEDGAEITTTIRLDQNQELVSMSVESDNGSATSSLTHEVMWGDAIVIEVDETLPRTSIPVWFDSEIFDDVNDHDDHDDDDSEEMFPCDGGNTWIPWDWVNNGYEDCEDGSDEYDDGDDDWGYFADDGDGHDDHDDHGDDVNHDDDGPPSPEDAMNEMDSDGDGYMSQDEFVTNWNNENPDAPIDSDQSFLTTEDVEDLIELCDYDAPSDLIDINEMQCFIDNLVGMMPDDENTPSLDDFFSHFDTDDDGHLTVTEFIDVNDVPDDEQDDVHDMFDMYDNDDSGGLDYSEFEPLYDMMVDSDHDDDSDDDSDGMERNDATGFVADNQTLNAPITDFEVHFLSDCEEEYDEDEDQMVQPDLSTCTNEFSIPLNGGDAEGVTITYTDHDGDGLVSPGDEVYVEWSEYDGEEIDKMEIYDNWASQYSSESSANPPVLPGFGSVLGAIALLGASMASRRDWIGRPIAPDDTSISNNRVD